MVMINGGKYGAGRIIKHKRLIADVSFFAGKDWLAFSYTELPQRISRKLICHAFHLS